MKKLSDYKGEEALELWADLLEPLSAILADKKVANAVKSGQSKMIIAKTIIKTHSKEANEILLRIDPTPINGLTIVVRLITLLAELGSNEDVKTFFGFAAQANTENESFGSVTENTEAEEQ